MGVADQVLQQAFGELSVQANGIPMLFVHMIPREDGVGVTFPEGQGPIRVAFGVESIRFHQIGEHKNLTQGPKSQGILVKRQILGTVLET